MRIYAISGLGADQRVFDFLNLKHELIPLEWIEVYHHESLKDYALRLSQRIDTESEFALMGVSFGGLVAIEISKVLHPKRTILISSIETREELRLIYRGIGKWGLLKRLPNRAFNLPRKVAHFLFGAKNKKLLNAILDDTDLSFVKWAINELLIWKNEEHINNRIRIHGTNDKLLSCKDSNQTHFIKGGEHFMIVDKAKEISEIINSELNDYPMSL